ncbi:hypothetical protein [Kitasatospora sp. NPDC088134]|uniref:hypothetical protein n=1 Tax=Kitasatospora sp. NPDC088134 TaxID=3364071 RepID=UPI0037FFE214
MYWVGLALFALLGGELAAVVTGAARLGDGDVARFVIGINLVPWTALVAGALTAAGRRRRPGPAAKGPMFPAPARIESAQAQGEGPQHTVRLDLTVAAKGRGAYRVHATARVNVMDLADFRPGRTVDVTHDPARPWRVEVSGHQEAPVQVPLDTAPEATRATPPPPVVPTRRFLITALVATVLGATAYLALWGV